MCFNQNTAKLWVFPLKLRFRVNDVFPPSDCQESFRLFLMRVYVTRWSRSIILVLLYPDVDLCAHFTCTNNSHAKMWLQVAYVRYNSYIIVIVFLCAYLSFIVRSVERETKVDLSKHNCTNEFYLVTEISKLVSGGWPQKSVLYYTTHISLFTSMIFQTFSPTLLSLTSRFWSELRNLWESRWNSLRLWKTLENWRGLNFS